ncbi:hypothetical protein L7F22_044404 [Adiantum nelumboides]|nr:hypothetical protein [Adiantum nelumboides]
MPLPLTDEAIPEEEINRFSSVVVDGEEYVIMHDLEKAFGGLSDSWKQARAITIAKNYHDQKKSNFLGYQVNYNLSYQEDFGVYLDTHVNNIGDAFQEGNKTVNNKFMERAVLDYYIALWHAKWPNLSKDLESYWGFTLTMGSTEGNLYGMWNARDYLSGKKY